QGDQARFPEPRGRLRRDLQGHVQEAAHRAVPRAAEDHRSALPRTAPAQPSSGRPGEVRRLRVVCLGLSRRRDLRGGRGQHRGGALLAGRAVRPRLPDQLRPLHPVRPVHRGVPHARAHDDQRVRTGRLQPRQPHLHQGAAARRPGGGHGGQPARHVPGHRRTGLLPGPGDRGRARHGAPGRPLEGGGRPGGRLHVRPGRTGVGAGDRPMTQLAAYTTSTGEAVQFWILGTIAVIGALCTVFMKRAVHSALCLAGTMIILAVFYLANGAYFLGVVQIVVYTGAVMMLFLFVVMLVGVTAADSLKETIKGQRWLALLCMAGFGILLIGGIGNASLTEFNGIGAANAGGNVEGIAALLFTRYVFAFEITGALLITAAVGAMVLTHRERTERARTQRELAEQRVREGTYLPPLPAPGVYARHNAVDIAGLLPDGTPSDLTVSATLRERGQIRDVSQEAMNDLRALEQRAEERLGRTAIETAPSKGTEEGQK